MLLDTLISPTGQPLDDATLEELRAVLEGERFRAAGARETALHRAADAHHAKLSVAIRYAFARGRKALKSGADVEAAVAAVGEALEKVLPAALQKIFVAGGQAAAGMLRVAAFNPDQERDEQGQWVTAYHGTISDKITSIKKHGLRRILSGSNYGGIAKKNTVYVTTSRKAAEIWAQHAVDSFHPRGKAAVVEVRIPKREAKLLRPDRNFEGRDKNSNFEFARDVKPEWIKSVRTQNNNTGKWRAAEAIGGDLVVYIVVILEDDDKLRTAKRGDERIGPFAFRFDATNPRATDWADRHAAELITNITETTREDINNAIAEALESGTFDQAYDEVLAAVGDEDRAELITAHELMVAAHEGQRESWRQALDEGLLSGTEKPTWIVTGDDKVCPICEYLDGRARKLTGVYVGQDGERIEGPPAHVRCRCTEGLS